MVQLEGPYKDHQVQLKLFVHILKAIQVFKQSYAIRHDTFCQGSLSKDGIPRLNLDKALSLLVPQHTKQLSFLLRVFQQIPWGKKKKINEKAFVRKKINNFCQDRSRNI